MTAEKFNEHGGEMLLSSISPVPITHVEQYEQKELPFVPLPLDANGIIGSDASGLDQEFYIQMTPSEGEQ